MENVATWDTICVIESEPPIFADVFKEHRDFDKAFNSEVIFDRLITITSRTVTTIVNKREKTSLT